MYCSVDQLQEFYKSEIGGIVQTILMNHIAEAWPDVRDFRVMGCGYALPYLSYFQTCSAPAERVIALMPKDQGVVFWPEDKKNLVLSCEEDRFPIENASIDRVILVHHLEGCNDLRRSIREVWRVLKANGRVLVVVPNRLGAWAHADWSPFGHGRPFTMSQLSLLLNDNLFEVVSHKSALFVPPIPDSPVMMRSANLIERMGRTILPFVAGVHIVEVSKRIYASADNKGGGSAVFSKTKKILGSPVPQSFTPSQKKQS
tara:strand:- start:1639 stop:2412 length:774 start_codon:yes stop_codon:yes gene_type:complete